MKSHDIYKNYTFKNKAVLHKWYVLLAFMDKDNGDEIYMLDRVTLHGEPTISYLHLPSASLSCDLHPCNIKYSTLQDRSNCKVFSIPQVHVRCPGVQPNPPSWGSNSLV